MPPQTNLHLLCNAKVRCPPSYRAHGRVLTPSQANRVVFEGTPADLVADRSTLTGKHLAEYVGAS